MLTPTHIESQFAGLTDHWSPKVIGRVNDQYVKIAKLKGEFVWHSHDAEDELFLVIRGRIKIQLEDGAAEFGPGEFVVVPRGVRHAPMAAEECWVMLIETVTTQHTGGVVTSQTRSIEEQLGVHHRRDTDASAAARVSRALRGRKNFPADVRDSLTRPSLSGAEQGDSLQPSVSAAPWIASFEFARRTLAGNLEGISDSESFLLPATVSNSVNWLAGHILIHRDRIHALLDLEPAWAARLGDGSWYRRGGARAPTEPMVPLSAICHELEHSQVSVLTMLARVDAARLAAPATHARTVAEQLALFGAHDWYHIGQIGVVRRLMGKPGAVG